jgi:hypothetical protein
MSVPQFVDDIKKMNLSDEFFEKYRCLVQFPGLTIAHVLDVAKKSEGGLKSLLKPLGSLRPGQAPSLDFEKKNGKYKVLRGDYRGVINTNSPPHMTLEEAAFKYVDLIMNMLYYPAPDSKIDKGQSESPFMKNLRAERKKKLGLE